MKPTRKLQSKKSIAYVILNCKETTGNKVVFEHANAFLSKGYDVKIYTIFGGYPKYFPIRISINGFLDSVFHSKPDVLVASFWPTAYFVYFLMRAKKKFYFSQDWEEDFYDNRLIKYLARMSYKLPLRNIVNSKYVFEKITKFKGNTTSIAKIKYALLDTNIFRPSKKNKRTGVVKILSVISWYNRHKGPDILVKVVQGLKVLHPNYHFTLVSREKKPYKPVFDKFISNPKQFEIARLYQESDILLATSRTEGFYLPGIEAMASGCIFITTNNGGIFEYTVHGKNAFILEKSEDLLEKELIDSLIHNNKFMAKLRKNGIITAKMYDKKYIIDDFEKIYFTISNGKFNENS